MALSQRPLGRTGIEVSEIGSRSRSRTACAGYAPITSTSCSCTAYPRLRANVAAADDQLPADTVDAIRTFGRQRGIGLGES